MSTLAAGRSAMTVALAIAAILFDWAVGLFRWLTAEHSGDAASHVRLYR